MPETTTTGHRRPANQPVNLPSPFEYERDGVAYVQDPATGSWAVRSSAEGQRIVTAFPAVFGKEVAA